MTMKRRSLRRRNKVIAGTGARTLGVAAALFNELRLIVRRQFQSYTLASYKKMLPKKS